MALSDLYGKILAMGAQVLRRQTVMPMLVNHVSLEAETNTKPFGGTVEIIIPPELSSRGVVPGANPPASSASPEPTTVKVDLNNWREVNFPLTDRHIQLIENSEGKVPMFLESAAATLAEEISASILANYKGIYGYVGTAGTTPFAATPVDAQNAKKVLTAQKCPRTMRQLVLDNNAYANALGLPQFSSALNFGSREAIAEGEITRALGFDWHEDLTVATHTSTPLSAGAATVNGAHAVGAKTVSIAKATNASPLVEGDIISFAGDSQTYVVTANVNLAVGNTNVTIEPGLRVAKVGGEAVTLRASHVVNVAFHPYAFAFASRPAARLNIPELQQGKVLATWVDDMTGVVLALEIKDEYHQTGFYLSCLWGSKLVRAELATRIAG